MKHTLMLFVALAFAVGLAQQVPAQDAAAIVGVWKLKTFSTKLLETGKVEDAYGANPEGTLVLTKGGNYVYVGFADGRKKPAAATATDAERVALFTTMFSHGGTFKIEGGGNVTFTVTMAWNETWKGQMQKRTLTIEGGKLIVQTPPFKRLSDGKEVVTTTVLERAE